MHKNRIKFLFCLAFWAANSPALSAAPQNTDNVVDLGVYKLGVDTTDGFAIRREVNIDLPFLKVHKTGEIGFGNPVVHATDSDSDSDSDEDAIGDQSSRRKRAVIEHKSLHYGNLKRSKRAPCFYGYGAGGGSATTAPSTDVEEARRRRRAASRILQAARKNRSTKKTRSKSKKGRRRRQAELDDSQKVSNKFQDHVNEALKKVENFWQSVVQMTREVTEAVKKTFSPPQNLPPDAVNA